MAGLLVLAAACSPLRPSAEPVLPRSSAYLPELLDLMEAGLDRAEPTANVVQRATGASLFDGSYDWHSCIFAHWALLTQARRDGDEARARRVLARVTDEALAEERARLRSPEFQERLERRSLTYDYGLGWLLLLLTEIERQGDVGEGTLAFRDEVERRLLDRLEEGPFPALAEDRAIDGRRVIGYYNSLALSWFLLSSAGVRTEGAADRLAQVRAERLDPWREQLSTAATPERFEFLWVQSLGYLLDDRAPFAPPLPAYELDGRDFLPEEVTMGTTHLLGVEASRMWPLALRARGDEAAARLLDEELASLLGRRELWDGDFAVVSHWMPQFIWVNFWLADGEPR